MRTPATPHKTGAVRSEYSHLPVFQYGALLHAPKIPTANAHAPFRKHAAFHSHRSSSLGVADWNVKPTNRHKTDSELLTNSISMPPVCNRGGIPNFGSRIPLIPVNVNAPVNTRRCVLHSRVWSKTIRDTPDGRNHTYYTYGRWASRPMHRSPSEGDGHGLSAIRHCSPYSRRNADAATSSPLKYGTMSIS